jgi:hypothetical protein
MVPPGEMGGFVSETIRERLEPAIARCRGRITIENVFDKHERGMFQILLVTDPTPEIVAVVVTEVIEWTSGRRCIKLLLGGGYGSLWTVPPVMAKIEEMGAEIGCASVLVDGRKGWERILPDGYEFSHSVFEKEL